MIAKKFAQSVVTGALMVLAAGAANATPCSVTDVTFSSTFQGSPQSATSATACSNALDGTGNTPNLTLLASAWGSGFVEGVTLGDAADGSATGAMNVLGGFQFTLSNISATEMGMYTLTITDTNGASAPNLPFYLDFVLYLKGGSFDTAAYFFDDRLVDEVGGGRWEVTFLNNANNTNNPDLSNASVWVRNGTNPNGGGGQGTPMPEPGTLTLVAGALLAAGALRRRRN